MAKMKSNSRFKASAISGKIGSIIGYPLGLLSFMLACSYASEEDSDGVMMFCFFVFLFCVFLIIRGIRIKKLIARFKKYTALISGQQMTLLDDIARSTSKSRDFVKKDLQLMITKGYYVDMEIDMAANKIIPGIKTAQALAAMQANKDKYEKYTCPDCGGSGVKPKGEQKACEYCGSIIL